MKYGFIGLGNLGQHLAGSLVRAGFDVTVTDIAKENADPLIAKGAHWASDAADVAPKSIASSPAFRRRRCRKKCSPARAALSAR